MFSKILGQDRAIATLQQHIANHRLPSAYLFTGISNIGKSTAAKALTQALNCQHSQSEACGSCPPCLQIQADQFLYLRHVEPSGQFIKMAQVQESIEWLGLRPEEGVTRVLIFDHAEKMNKESANALLKTLEEPPPHTLIILLAPSRQQLLETIASRCRPVAFQPLESSHLLTIFEQQYPKLTEEQRQFISWFAMGRIRQDWIEKVENLQSLRREVIKLLSQGSKLSMLEVQQLTDKVTQAKEGTWPYVLEMIEYWLRDLVWVKQALPSEQLLHRDAFPQLQQQAQHHTLETLQQQQQALIDTYQKLSFNANKPLAFDALWQALGTGQ